jgi:transposase
MIRIDQIWLATEPMDMRAGPDTALACDVKQFGGAQVHHAYVFTNKRANRYLEAVNEKLAVSIRQSRLVSLQRFPVLR